MLHLRILQNKPKLMIKFSSTAKVVLNAFLLQAAHQLYTANANYPKRIPYHNPPEYSIESLEVIFHLFSLPFIIAFDISSFASCYELYLMRTVQKDINRKNRSTQNMFSQTFVKSAFTTGL